MATQDLIQTWIENETARHIKRMERLEALRPALECADALIAAFPEAGIEACGYLGSYETIEVTLDVPSLKDDVAKYLEWVGDWAAEKGEPGFEFTETTDYTSSWTAQRTYRSKFFSLCARIPNDSPGCKKVIVGYEEVTPQPVYKIVCED